MQVIDQKLLAKVATGAAQLFQGPLEFLRLSARARLTESMDDLIGGHKQQPVGEFRPFLTDSAGLEVWRAVADPAAEQVPGAEP